MNIPYLELSAKSRRVRLIAMMDLALSQLRQPCSTGELVDTLATALGLVGRDKGKLARDVVGLAPVYPNHARRGTTTFQKYGREMLPWVWSPGVSQHTAEDRVMTAGTSTRAATSMRDYLPAGQGKVQCLTCDRHVAAEMLVEGVCPSCRE